MSPNQASRAFWVCVILRLLALFTFWIELIETENVNAELLTTFLLTETSNRSRSIELNRVVAPACPLSISITAEMKWEVPLVLCCHSWLRFVTWAADADVSVAGEYLGGFPFKRGDNNYLPHSHNKALMGKSGLTCALEWTCDALLHFYFTGIVSVFYVSRCSLTAQTSESQSTYTDYYLLPQ